MNFADAFYNFIKGVNSFQLVEQVPVKSAIIISLLLMAFIFALFAYKIYKSDVSNLLIILLFFIFLYLVSKVVNFIIITTQKSWIPVIILCVFLFLIDLLECIARKLNSVKLLITNYVLIIFVSIFVIAFKPITIDFKIKPNEEQDTYESEDTEYEIEGFQ